MRIKEGFVLQQIDDEYIVVPIGQESERLHGIIRLNPTGYYLWNCLSKGNFTNTEELASVLASKYGVSEMQARQDVDLFLKKLISWECIEKIKDI